MKAVGTTRDGVIVEIDAEEMRHIAGHKEGFRTIMAGESLNILPGTRPAHPVDGYHGLTKREYAAVHIAAAIAGSHQVGPVGLNFEDVADDARNIAAALFPQRDSEKE